MKELVKIIFEFNDGTQDVINDPRSALLFQSRCNSAGILSGLEHCIIPVEKDKEKLEEHAE